MIDGLAMLAIHYTSGGVKTTNDCGNSRGLPNRCLSDGALNQSDSIREAVDS